MQDLHLVIPQPTGSCSGVVNAVDFLGELRQKYPGTRMWALHQPVHHGEADKRMEEAEIRILDSPVSVTPGDLVVGSAHGTKPETIRLVKDRGAVFVDSVCPLVAGNFEWVRDLRTNVIVYVGKPGHPEYEATVARAREENFFSLDLHQQDVEEAVSAIRSLGLLPITVLRQTTIPADDDDLVRLQVLLREGLPEYDIREHGECFATQNRQRSLSWGIEQYRPDAVLVLTAHNSSNGGALVSTAKKRMGQKTSSVLQAEWPVDLVRLAATEGLLDSADTLLLTAAASVLEPVVEKAVQLLRAAVSARGRPLVEKRPWLPTAGPEPELRKPELPRM